MRPSHDQRDGGQCYERCSIQSRHRQPLYVRYVSRNAAGPGGGCRPLRSLNAATSWSRNQMLRGSLSNRRCQCNFKSYVRSKGGNAAATLEVIDANRVTTAYGSVATSCVSITMNGALSTFDVYNATFRRILRRSMKRSRMSWLRPSRLTTMCSAARNADTVK